MSFFSPNQLGVPVTLQERRLSQQRYSGVCTGIFVPFALFHRLPAAERTHGDALLGDATERAGRFSLLKVVLGAIPTVYANHEVRQNCLFRIPL